MNKDVPLSTYRQLKTEHGGAKHTQGYWGTKAEAKTKSCKKRRQEAKKVQVEFRNGV